MKFGGLVAVNQVSFAVNKGQIFSVIGPNGAGKTTLFNAITGIYEPTSGSVTLEGSTIRVPFSWRSLSLFLGIGLASAIGIFVLINSQSLWERSIVDNYVYQQPFSWQAAVAGLMSYLSELSSDWTFLPLLIGFVVGFCGAFSVWRGSRRTPDVVVRAGIARTFQNIRLFRQMSVLDNVMIGVESGKPRGLWSIFHRQSPDEAMAVLEFVGLAQFKESSAGSLPYGHQRRLEIARALATKPKILLLDEPAAGMNPSEAAELMKLIRRIRETGTTVVLIEHHMKVVMGVSDRVVVLDYGNKIAEGTPEEICADPKVIEAYLGKAQHE